MTDIHLQTLLKRGGFVVADTTIKPRIVAAITSREKQGKTHMALSAPGPIALFDSDYGLEGVVSKFPKKDILVYRVPMPDPEAKDSMNSCYDVFKQIDAAYDQVLANRGIRSVVFDTSSELWEIVRLGYFGRLEKVKPTDYGPANGAFRRFIKKALDSDKNVYFVQKMKQEYLNNSFTGKYIMSGFGDIPYITQAVFRPFFAAADEELPDGSWITRGQFGVEIMESRHNPMLNNTFYVGELASLPLLSSLVVGTSIEAFE